jgi:hypothetical protein
LHSSFLRARKNVRFIDFAASNLKIKNVALARRLAAAARRRGKNLPKIAVIGDV